MRVLTAIAVAVPMAACASLDPGDPFPGWLAPYSTAALAERYCYRTLGAVDCHAAPLEDAGARRVGFFDAPLAGPGVAR